MEHFPNSCGKLNGPISILTLDEVCHNLIMKTKIFFLFFSIIFSASSQANVSQKSKNVWQPKRDYQHRRDLELLLQKKQQLTITPKETEFQSFKVVQESFQKLSGPQFRLTADRFLKNHPASPMADDVLYLIGLSQFSEAQYGASLKSFNHLIRFYPSSNRLPSAKLAKAAVFKKLKLPQISKKHLAELAEQFKGSPEAFRAESEIRILKQ